jgi:tetratricopeptide (TPR) repeat protein
MVLHLAWAGDRPRRIWILPFDNPEADASVAHLEEAIPALVAVAISQSDQHVVVDRRYLNQVLAEQSLTLEGLTAQESKHEVGRLLGATVMISGSFMKQGRDLLITMRASDVETGMVAATAEARGPAGQPGRLVSELYRRLARDLGRRLPDLRPDQIDEAPLANLHFMRGLGYYYSARYNQALAEFMQAAREKPLTDISRLWLANAYLAQEDYDHAYLELSRLRPGGSSKFRKAEIEAKMRACEKHLSAEEVERIRELSTLQASDKENK